MSEGTNSICISGRVGADPEERTYGTDGKIASFSVAVNKRQRNGADQPPSWFNIKVFGKQAEPVLQYLKKGRQVIVTGRMEANVVEDPEKGKRTFWDLVANSVEFVGPRDDAPAPAATADDDVDF